MSVHNNSAEARASRAARTLTLTAATTMTVAQVLNNDIVQLAGQALTLPPASAAMKGATLLCIDSGAGKVIVAAGYGGSGSDYDTVTLAAGKSVQVYCDGSNWYQTSYTAT